MSLQDLFRGVYESRPMVHSVIVITGGGVNLRGSAKQRRGRHPKAPLLQGEARECCRSDFLENAVGFGVGIDAGSSDVALDVS